MIELRINAALYFHTMLIYLQLPNKNIQWWILLACCNYNVALLLITKIYIENWILKSAPKHHIYNFCADIKFLFFGSKYTFKYGAIDDSHRKEFACLIILSRHKYFSSPLSSFDTVDLLSTCFLNSCHI